MDQKTETTVPAVAEPQFVSEEARRLYAERARRFEDVIALRPTDRVPMIYNGAFWHATYSGISFKETMYNYDSLERTYEKAIVDLQPDVVSSPFNTIAWGPTLETLGFRAYEWPGHGVADNRPYQYVDREYMKVDEYDAYLDEPNWFLLTRYMPRISEAFAPFAEMRNLHGAGNVKMMFAMRSFANSKFRDLFDRMIKAGDESEKVGIRDRAFAARLKALGFPMSTATGTTAPYDYFADFLRGSKGIMLDIRRNPDKLMAAMERVIPVLIQEAVAGARMTGGKIAFIPLHWGLDGFMSPAQFQKFYWPPLRRVMMGLIDAGLTPMVFWEGNCTTRLELITDIPAGKCIYQFERTDLFRAKEILGGSVCIRGNVPASILIGGTPDDVRDYCRKLIDVVGKGGGFILEGAASIPNEAPPANVFAMYEMAKTYGRYD